MTRQLEETINTLEPNEGVRVLEAVDGTLDALRNDALLLGDTQEIREVISRIDVYRAHLGRQLSELLSKTA